MNEKSLKFTIVYQSRQGTTAGYARQMAMYLWQKGVNVSLCSTSDFAHEKLDNCDCLMVGCWTSGWFIVNQHPNSIWTAFAAEHLQGRLPANILLFTTYKIRTGSLFRRMERRMNLDGVESIRTLKSRTGFLSSEDKEMLDHIIDSLKQTNR